MRRILEILALSLSFLVFPVQTHAQANKGQQTPKGDKPPSPVTPVIPEHKDSAPLRDPNWVLVIVGSVTCFVIGGQSWEMLRQNRNMVAKERARITVEIPSDPLELDDGPEWTEGLNAVWAGTKILVVNLGATNAFNVTARAEIVGTPNGGALGFDEDSVLNLPTVLKPNVDPISVDIVTLLKGTSHVAAVKDETEIMHLVGTITYDDVFGNTRKTQFRYLWHTGQAFYVPGWTKTAKGNRTT